jgi:flagellar protein FliL
LDSFNPPLTILWHEFAGEITGDLKMSDIALAIVDDEPDALEDLPRRAWNGKRLAMLAGAVTVLAGGVFALIEFNKPDVPPANTSATVESTYLKLPDIFVNLASGQGRPRFLKLGVSLEIKGEDEAAKIKKNLPRVVDSFQVYLRELRVEDLNGSAGMFLLKEELLRRVNTQLAPARVENVLFEEMLVQ